MAARDLAHDGEAEPRAGARRAGHAIEALEHTLALGRRNAGAVVLDLEKGMRAVAAGAHGDAAAALRILDRVVHQIRERLTEAERNALHPRRLQLEAEGDTA